MKEAEIAIYDFNMSNNRYELNGDATDLNPKMPLFFIIKNNTDPKFKVSKRIFFTDSKWQPFDSGYRKVRSDIYYGDRFNKCNGNEFKSLFICRYLTKERIEFHFFDGFCPRKENRSSFFTYYFNKTKMAGCTNNNWLRKRRRKYD